MALRRDSSAGQIPCTVAFINPAYMSIKICGFPMSEGEKKKFNKCMILKQLAFKLKKCKTENKCKAEKIDDFKIFV